MNPNEINTILNAIEDSINKSQKYSHKQIDTHFNNILTELRTALKSVDDEFTENERLKSLEEWLLRIQERVKEYEQNTTTIQANSNLPKILDLEKPFKKRLACLLESSNKSVTKTAQELRLTPTQYKKLNKNASLNIDILLKLSKYYNVSTDYLLGLTDEQTPPPKSIEFSEKDFYWLNYDSSDGLKPF